MTTSVPRPPSGGSAATTATTNPSSKPAAASTVPQTPTMTTPPTTPPPPLPLPGGLPLPESNGTGTWSTVSNGITVELRMEPVAPHAGDNVHFSITASDPNQPCCVTTLYLGDETFVPPPRYDVPCPAASPSVFTEEVDHVYAQAGAFEVHVEPAANNFCAGPMTAFVSAHLLVRILVLP